MKVQVIGNRGSFLNDVFNALTKKGFYVISTLSEEFNIIDSVSYVVYVGGETRDQERMHEHNVSIPSIILNQCQEKGVSFIYLSSLSVFGWCLDDKVTAKSTRHPVDVYGISKLEMDCFALGSGGERVCAVMPASIHSGRGRSSVEKIIKLFDNYPILGFFSFPGSLSYIRRDDLIDIIINCIENNRSGFVIASNNYHLKTLSRKLSVPIPKFPLIFIRLLAFFIGKKRALLLKMIIRGNKYI